MLKLQNCVLSFQFGYKKNLGEIATKDRIKDKYGMKINYNIDITSVFKKIITK